MHRISPSDEVEVDEWRLLTILVVIVGGVVGVGRGRLALAVASAWLSGVSVLGSLPIVRVVVGLARREEERC